MKKKEENSFVKEAIKILKKATKDLKIKNRDNARRQANFARKAGQQVKETAAYPEMIEIDQKKVDGTPMTLANAQITIDTVLSTITYAQGGGGELAHKLFLKKITPEQLGLTPESEGPRNYIKVGSKRGDRYLVYGKVKGKPAVVVLVTLGENQKPAPLPPKILDLFRKLGCTVTF